MIIAGDADNVAVRDADGQLHLLSSRRGRFDAEMWLRRDGDAREIAEVKAAEAGRLRLRRAGLHRADPGRRTDSSSSRKRVEAMVEDCARATIVVETARGWTQPCSGPQLIVTPKLAASKKVQSKRASWATASNGRRSRANAATGLGR